MRIATARETEPGWYVVRTHRWREAQVESVLLGRGVEAYLPLLRGKRLTADGKHKLEPLFPGYLFARLVVPSPEWLAARSAPGVSYLLGASGGQGAPALVPNGLIEEIRRRSEAAVRRQKPTPFAVGERVAIVAGPFVGLEAVFAGQLSSSGRSRVLLEIVSRLVPIQIDHNWLERATM